jgi:SNF2 family DNA or RNA helicase
MPVSIAFDPSADAPVLEALRGGRFVAPDRLRLRLAAERLSLIEGFEELICLPQLRGVEKFPHQERTALRVLRRLRGRAILGDEVGLGKTIEACLIAKECLLRGLARRVLVLCPPSLVEQWQNELAEKFGLDFVASTGAEFREAGVEGWRRFDRIVASLSLARLARHAEVLEEVGTDLVIVDEAHHVRNRTSSAWRLLSKLPRKYLLLLTATPVQNDLDELYNLITLLRPGQLGTPAEFRRRFVDPSDPRKPRNVTALRELMQDVMIRNTRSSVTVKLPPRRSRTVRLAPTAAERNLLEGVSAFIRDAWGGPGPSRVALTTLQLQAGSSPAALAPTLERLGQTELARQAREIGLGVKARGVVDIVRAIGREPVLVFTRFVQTLEALGRLLEASGLQVYRYYGGVSPSEREEQLRRFSRSGGVMLCSDVGGEGKNLQFCRTLVNVDLPWNPMRIEQRVGRLHRIGQDAPIQIVNLCLEGSIEDHLLRILDEKLNMFELVMGELETILGPLEEDGDFEDVLMELAVHARGPEELALGVDSLGERMLALRRQYDEDVRYDETLFGREFEVEEA